ncbi:hypothetical protein LSAT2_000444 [Lamellibrachia satsuma]|nr:hypothetical protein LSAT2_000444 [Lamellibrachia satsuma]
MGPSAGLDTQDHRLSLDGGQEAQFDQSSVATWLEIAPLVGNEHPAKTTEAFSLISIAGKILANILLNRLTLHFDQTLLPESQCGFRKERGTLPETPKAIRVLSIGKAPGSDSIPAEVSKVVQLWWQVAQL